MCECCGDVVKRSVKCSVEQSNKGKELGIRILAVASDPKPTHTRLTTIDEPARTPVEEASAR